MPKLRPISVISATLILVSFILGFWGFCLWDTGGGLFDHVYRSLQLFALDAPVDGPPLTWQLEAARLLAPLTLLLGLLATIFHVSRDAFQGLLLSFSNKHTIVTGLNEFSANLIEDALRRKRRVVVITPDADSPWLPEVRRQGAISLVGSCSDIRLLSLARVDRASYFFAFSEDDVQNVETVTTLSEKLGASSKRNARSVHCYVRFQNSTLQQAFKGYDLLYETSDNIEISLVNLDELAARKTLEEFPLEVDEAGDVRDDIRLVIFGCSSVGFGILHHALRIAHYRTGQNLSVSILTSRPDYLSQQLDQRFPQLDKVANVEVIEVSGSSPTRMLEALLKSSPSQSTWFNIVCAGENDAFNFSLSQQLRGALLHLDFRILCYLSSKKGLGSVLSAGNSGIQLVSTPEELASWDHVVNETYDARARFIHDFYISKELAKERTMKENESLVRWEALKETKKDQNRLQADHLPVKLRAVGVDITDLPSREELERKLNENLEKLSEMEHQRWNANMYLSGWKFAPSAKSESLKTSPHLVSWSELPDEIKQYDRDAVLNISRLLSERCR